MKTVDYGDLRVSMTSNMAWVWNDKGTKGKRDGTIYNPVAQDGLRPLGSIGFSSYDDKNKNWGALLVRSVPGSSGKPACVSPRGYEKIWGDHGSGGDHDVAIWRPLPPSGYVALGDYCTGSYGTPSTESMYCIREDYVTDGVFNTSAWYDDRKTGSKSNVCCWDVLPLSTSGVGSEYVPIRTDLFIAKNGRHAEPPPNSLARTLRLHVGRNFAAWNAPLPTFTIHTLPHTGQEFSTKEEASVRLPYTAFFASNDRRSLALISNPFINVSRACCWHVQGVWRNGGSGNFNRKQEIQYGITKEMSQSMSQSTGVTISAEAGVSAGPLSMGTSVSLNHQLTRTTSSSVSEFTSKTVTEEFTVPAGTVSVLFSRRIFYLSKRSDGSEGVANVAMDATDEFHMGKCDIPKGMSMESD